MFTRDQLGELLFLDFMQRKNMMEGIGPNLVHMNTILNLNEKFINEGRKFDKNNIQ